MENRRGDGYFMEAEGWTGQKWGIRQKEDGRIRTKVALIIPLYVDEGEGGVWENDDCIASRLWKLCGLAQGD